MTRNRQQRGAVSIAVPTQSEHPEQATEQWLLALWQASRRRTWRLWRSSAAVSLEYAARSHSVRYQVHHARNLLAELTEAMLPSLFPGIELTHETSTNTGRATSRPGAIVTFQLRHSGSVDLRKDNDPHGVTGLLAALESLASGEETVVQLLLEPTWLTTEDGRQPAFWFMGRLAVFAESGGAAQQRARILSSAFGQFASFNGLRFSPVRHLHAGDLAAIEERRWPRRFLPPGLPATPAQIATLFHPPAAAQPGGRLLTAGARKTPTQTNVDGVVLGEGRDGMGHQVNVLLNPDDLLRHALLVGPSGSGKTTLLSNLAVELARAGHGLTVIDPHGSLVTDIARRLPKERAQDAALLRFADTEFPIALNPLRTRPGQEFVAVDELVEILQRVFGREYWGPLLDLVLRNAALAAVEVGGSLADTARLLQDSWYRDRVLAQVENEQTVRFFSQMGESGPFDRRFLPAIHRLQRLLATPWMRNILTQSWSGLDFTSVFDERRIVLADLSGVGGTNARLLGSLLLLLIRQAAFARDSSGSGAQHFVVVDEASWFVSRTVSELYDQARKFNVGLVLAVQRLGQLTPDDVREAVLANAGTFATFRVQEHDEATLIARRLASSLITSSDLQRLPNFEAYVQAGRQAGHHEPSWLRTIAPAREPLGAADQERRLLIQGRELYARPRELVEAESRRHASLTSENDEPEIRNFSVEETALSANPA